MIRKWWPPAGLTLMCIPENYCCDCPNSEPQLPPLTSAGDPPILAILAGRSDPVSYEVTDFFPLVPGVPKTLCVPSKVEFLFSPVLWNSCD